MYSKEYMELVKYSCSSEFKTLSSEKQTEIEDKLQELCSRDIETQRQKERDEYTNRQLESIGKSFDFKLNVPSGKIAFANDLRCLFPKLRGGELHTYGDTCEGMAKVTKYFEKHGMIQVFVSNRSPSINQSGNTISIDPLAEYDEENDERNIPEGFKEIGSICTDLWWWSAMDYDHYKSLYDTVLKKDEKKFLNEWVVIANVEPGVYNIHSIMKSDNAEKYPTYAFESLITKD